METPPPTPHVLFKASRDIVYEDDDCFVVNKAAGICTHRNGARHNVIALADLIAHKTTFPPTDLRAGIVHRLDKDTSGLLICVKHEAALGAFKTLFQTRSITKAYWALVLGCLYQGTGKIVTGIQRHPTKRVQQHVVDYPEGRLAQTHYTVRELYPQHTLLDVNIFTGRTHQIRVHLAHLGHPILGDKLYGKKMHAATEKYLYLLAKRLVFTHPLTKKHLELEIAPPDFFQRKITLLRTAAPAPV